QEARARSSSELGGMGWRGGGRGDRGAQGRGGLLGQRVGDGRGGRLLGAGEILQLLGGPQRRVELDVQVSPRATVARRLVDCHHVWKRALEQRVVPAHERLQAIR